MKRKLIEVAMPLEAINREAAREKSIRHGHPATMHLWWARRPLAACRAVLFASLVDDPSSDPIRFPTEDLQEKERKRLFALIERMVKWENSNNDHLLKEIRDEIIRSIGKSLPTVYDPFCGGGSIPLEAHRLGLPTLGSDLNPVAVLISKALTEIPQRFNNLPPVNKNEQAAKLRCSWMGATGLAEDVTFYGERVREITYSKIGHFYPPADIVKEGQKQSANVIAWIWARTVQSPNPSFQGIHVPLVRSFMLSAKKGKEAWVEPVIDQDRKSYQFTVKRGAGTVPPGTVDRRGAKCLLSNSPISFDYIRAEGQAGRLGQRLMAIAVDGQGSRVYLPPSKDEELLAKSAEPRWIPETTMPERTLGFRVQVYGMRRHADLFTKRQLLALTTFSDVITEMHSEILRDAVQAGMPADNIPYEKNGSGARAYADVITLYLAFGLSRLLDLSSTLCPWSSNPAHELVVHMFARQALPMTWDFGEINPFCEAASWTKCLSFVPKVLRELPSAGSGDVEIFRSTAIDGLAKCGDAVIATDPPYYDQITYSDLSDVFYVFLRPTLKDFFPGLLSTLLTPKAEELIANQFRFDGNKEESKAFFEKGLGDVFCEVGKIHRSEYPFTLFYAFRQSEVEQDDEMAQDVVMSSGWETMLQGLVDKKFQILGTMPMRTERPTGIKKNINALASSIVLVCRPRSCSAETVTRRDLVSRLKSELPDALKKLKQGNIAATDLAQAAIGPGMAVFSRYEGVIEADGSKMNVRTALGLINQILDEVMSEQDNDLDPDSRWAVTWFETHAFEEGLYGDAETLSKAKNTSPRGLQEAGIISCRAGKVKLLEMNELQNDWDPALDKRLTVWEVTHHLLRILETRGEDGVAAMLKKVGRLGESARDLAYRLYSVCERKKWAALALQYNSLVISWSEISRRVAVAELNEQPLQGNLL